MKGTLIRYYYRQGGACSSNGAVLPVPQMSRWGALLCACFLCKVRMVQPKKVERRQCFWCEGKVVYFMKKVAILSPYLYDRVWQLGVRPL